MPRISNALIDLIQAIAEIPMTFWGIVILFTSMHMAMHGAKEIGYYFAGIGSTLVGINPITARNQSFHVQSVVPPDNASTGTLKVDASTTAR